MAFKLLLVDDSRTVRRVMAKALRLGGADIEIFEAENGADALELLAETWIDLAFVDINMPVMTGDQMVEKLKEEGRLDDLPVVIVSTEGSATRQDDLLAKGVRAFIRKPFKPEQVNKVVHDILGGAQ